MHQLKRYLLPDLYHKFLAMLSNNKCLHEATGKQTNHLQNKILCCTNRSTFLEDLYISLEGSEACVLEMWGTSNKTLLEI